MTKVAKIIERAAFKLRAASPINPATPELQQGYYDELVSMLEAWEKQEYNTGILVPDAGEMDTETDLAEPLDTTDAIVTNLAMKCATISGKEPDFQLGVESRVSLHEVQKEYRWKDAPDLEPTGITGEGDRTIGPINIRSYQ